jgi:hypothetical protein
MAEASTDTPTETPTLFVCHGDEGAREYIHAAGCRKRSTLRISNTRR